MITDDERRAAAARLRKVIGLREFAEVFGFDWADGSDWGWKDVSNLVADFIEPAKARFEDSGKKVDRDALLALADDLDRMGDGSMYDPCISDGHGIARRIREALGVMGAPSLTGPFPCARITPSSGGTWRGDAS